MYGSSSSLLSDVLSGLVCLSRCLKVLYRCLYASLFLLLDCFVCFSK